MRTLELSEAWEFGWEAAEVMQLRRDAACSFRDNLIWLEEMTEFAERFSKAPSLPNPGFPKVLPKK